MERKIHLKTSWIIRLSYKTGLFWNRKQKYERQKLPSLGGFDEGAKLESFIFDIFSIFKTFESSKLSGSFAVSLDVKNDRFSDKRVWMSVPMFQMW